MCEEFFRLNQQNGGFYALIQPAGNTEADYGEAFRAAYWYRGNSEKIIEVHSSYSANSYGWGDLADLMSCTYFGMTNPTLEYMEMFGMADGRNYPYKNLMNTNNPDNIDIFENRDPRLYETILVTRDSYREPIKGGDTKFMLWQGGNANSTDFRNFIYDTPEGVNIATGMKLWKFVLDFELANGKPLNIAYLRMADMHLMYAEALAETGNLQLACDEVNKVRARVGLGKIETMNPSLNLTSNKENLIAEILRERACEFGQEADRIHDMNRRKLVADYTKWLHNLVVWRKTADGQKDTRENTQLAAGEAWPDFIYETTPITQDKRQWWDQPWDNKWLLSPISRDEVNKGYGLIQNPGW